jgi:hypothetical protein
MQFGFRRNENNILTMHSVLSLCQVQVSKKPIDFIL